MTLAKIDLLKAGEFVVTPKVVCDVVITYLKTFSEFTEILEKLEYWHVYDHSTVPLDLDNYSVKATVNTGAEGIYVDWYLENICGKNGIHLGIFKILEDGFSGYSDMGSLSGMLVYATECFFITNY